MRLLVVDDEKVVLNSIGLIIKKENLSFIEMETASTGKEAIGKAISFHPDVIFMDINMPGLNGIEAMKSISKLYPQILFVVVTAYDVFEYAKESLKMGACDYIIKPFVPKRIVEVLVSLNEKVMRLAAERDEMLQLREKVSELSAFADDGALEIMISSRDVSGLLKKYDGIIPAKGGRIAVLEVSENLVIRAKAAMLEIAGSFPDVISGSFTGTRAMLFIPEGCELSQIERKLKDNIGGGGFAFACGSEQDIWNMRTSYLQALSVLGDVGGDKTVAEFSESGHTQSMSELYEKIAQCDPSMLEYGVEELFSCVSDEETFEKNVKKMVEALLVVAQLILGENSVNMHFAEAAAAGLIGVLESKDKYALLEASADFLVNIRRSAYTRNENKYIQAAMEYIDRNYSGDISIETAARYASVSVSTLSRLFRTELDKSFTEILIEKRISKACAMIKEGNLSMKEICFEVGYNDPNYFSRVFKKTTGLSPSDYKEFGI